ncbi:DNA polymerase iota isoform X2 [Varanus komodoensis]|uniref:DNA polymerase iota n=2 Tax=Varanus komodoensis TaxID=61221 RepID=A0A8D2L513_VARKO|nr:DNA polymerase iota isoform X2 [Varanus komodoensis]XP_044287489.1 DNA polymerase iota isoform X2 [Varanus komodoensis]
MVSAAHAKHRIIVHLDLDCFYAQVEMICNPALRGKPLGVHQKFLLVTCSYEARNCGLKKLMSVKDAINQCPDLVLVNGEDLTKYREMSYKFTALLEEFTPLVERLGLDENFVDVTDMVKMRLEQWKKDFSAISCPGHVYKNQTVDLHDPTHRRLAVGSQIAAEMREAMYNRLGLTGCAGIATNKLLSKLVTGIFKPNQQTVLLPEGRQDLMVNLGLLRKVPGIGPRTAKRLMALGLHTVSDLQTCSSEMLARELGVLTAQHIQKLSRGEDDSPVTPSRSPQSISDEDSFKKCSSEAEVRKRMETLLTNLFDRLHKDGRKPHTIKLTIRQISAAKQWLNRESRQCPIPPHVIQRIGTDDSSVKTHLVGLLMQLLYKMINVKGPFYITLLNVCFSNFKDPPASAKHSIGFYLTRPSPSSSSEKLVRKMENMNVQHATPAGQVDICEDLPEARNARSVKASLETTSLPKETNIPEFPAHLLPAGIDYDVFNQLPKDIKEEILSSQKEERDTAATPLHQTLPPWREELADRAQDKTSCAPSHSGRTRQNFSALAFEPTSEKLPQTMDGCASRRFVPQHSPLETAGELTEHADPVDDNDLSPALSPPSLLWTGTPEGREHPEKLQPDDGPSHCASGKEGPKLDLPSSVDPKTFSELPAEIQKELLVEWKGQEPISKIQASRTPEKLKKHKKGLPSSPQSNSLLRYFKPR